MTMTEILDSLSEAGTIVPVETIRHAARPPRWSPAPSSFATALAAWQGKSDGRADRLWLHQAKSLEEIAAGKNLVLATGTASGKSFVFQTAIVESLLRDNTTHLVFYPQKALAADQKVRWVEALNRVGLPADWVAEINGDVSTHEREERIRNARILLATPDVVHAWMMRSLRLPAVQGHLFRLRYVVIDEAHAFDGQFGSSTAYLLRRLINARQALKPTTPVQFIAASATIANPCEHLEALTGLPFSLVDEAQNGAACAERTIIHIEGPHQQSAREAHAGVIASEFLKLIGDDAFIVFLDSRQGVERVARRIADPRVLPYRSGFEASDRRAIEEALRKGELRGVISTSALELGIDIPQFVLGLTVGLPPTRKALRQRIGRVGRNRAGAFLVMAPTSAFTQIGTSFADYYNASAEASHLYLENRYIQYAQARCLVEETTNVQGGGELAGNWPAGFRQMLDCARPGGRRPIDLDQIASVGGDNPHHNYPLRHIGSQGLELKTGPLASDRLGTIATHQAIREAYPGATYYHLQKPYRVTEWRTSSFERSIRVKPLMDAEPTQPILRHWVNRSFEADEIIAGRLWQTATGKLGEAALQVVEAVEGYRIGNKRILYRDLKQTNPRWRRQQRDFNTTGVLLQISESWFAGSGAEQIAARKAIASALVTLLCRELSISPGEIEWVHNGIALCTSQGAGKIDDAIAIYDNVLGGLRLSGPLLDLLPSFAGRLQRGAEAAGEDALVDAALANRLANWVAALQPTTPQAASTIEVPPGEVLIYAPGSEVSFRAKGQVLQRRIIAPQMMPTPAGDLLFYRYETEEGASAWVSDDAIEPLGQHWARAIWDPDTGKIRSCA